VSSGSVRLRIFRWNYNYDETIHFIEGSVTFDDGRGTTWSAGAGDVVYFPKGSSVIWNVHTCVRKLAVCCQTFPEPIAAAVRMLRRLKATDLP
jgi:ethanolamine utilization protein EutQ (cupin superfamily)